MNKFIIVYIAAFIFIIVAALVIVGPKFLSPALHPGFTTVATSTIPKNTVTKTTMVTSTISTNYSGSISPCNGFSLVGTYTNSTYTAKCMSSGGFYGFWVAAGASGKESILMTGQDGRTYINQTSGYNCTTFFTNATLPSQTYNIIFKTGPGKGSCGNALMVINSTTTPPQIIYNYIFNGDFGNGQYTGWNATTPGGFGTVPLNITYANSNAMCYYGSKWSGYNGTYFATSYECGTQSSPGNITSSQFLVNAAKPFLNFRVISPQDNRLYVELIKGNAPVLIAHFNTFNQSLTINSSTTFQNVSIPLTAYVNQALKIRIVSADINSQNYIAAGDFGLGRRPIEQMGVSTNITIISN
jgi:hypothetical protein